MGPIVMEEAPRRSGDPGAVSNVRFCRLDRRLPPGEPAQASQPSCMIHFAEAADVPLWCGCRLAGQLSKSQSWASILFQVMLQSLQNAGTSSACTQSSEIDQERAHARKYMPAFECKDCLNGPRK